MRGVTCSHCFLTDDSSYGALREIALCDGSSGVTVTNRRLNGISGVNGVSGVSGVSGMSGMSTAHGWRVATSVCRSPRGPRPVPAEPRAVLCPP